MDLWSTSGLRGDERNLSINDIKPIPGTNANVLRFLAEDILEDPYGWLTLWGGPGIAKSLVLQSVVAEFIRGGVEARYVHAKDLEETMFKDQDGKSHWELWHRTTVLAIDELDDLNFSSDWVRAKLDTLLDTRYRDAVSGDTSTLMATQYDPEGRNLRGENGTFIPQPTLIPEKIVSRMKDGRFNRAWDEETRGPAPEQSITRHGVIVIPGLLQAKGQDMRQLIRRTAPGKIKPVR